MACEPILLPEFALTFEQISLSGVSLLRLGWGFHVVRRSLRRLRRFCPKSRYFSILEAGLNSRLKMKKRAATMKRAAPQHSPATRLLSESRFAQNSFRTDWRDSLWGEYPIREAPGVAVIPGESLGLSSVLPGIAPSLSQAMVLRSRRRGAGRLAVARQVRRPFVRRRLGWLRLKPVNETVMVQQRCARTRN